MINKPLTRKQVAEIKLANPHVGVFPNRRSRRERISKRNMVIQEVPLFDTTGAFVRIKEVLHKKITNLPRQYHGIKARKSTAAVAA